MALPAERRRTQGLTPDKSRPGFDYLGRRPRRFGRPYSSSRRPPIDITVSAATTSDEARARRRKGIRRWISIYHLSIINTHAHIQIYIFNKISNHKHTNINILGRCGQLRLHTHTHTHTHAYKRTREMSTAQTAHLPSHTPSPTHTHAHKHIHVNILGR